MITHLEVKNFKKISDFEADFNGGIYLVTGDNELGKSTLLQSIFSCLTGDRSKNMLQNGKEKGFIRSEFEKNGEKYTVRIDFTEKNPAGRLKITSENGMLDSNNKGVLQKLFNYQNFDAAEFISWSSSAKGKRKQVELVLSLFSDESRKRLAELDEQINKDFKAREDIGERKRVHEAMVSESKLTDDFIEKHQEAKDPAPIKAKIANIDEENQVYHEREKIFSSRKEKLDNWDNLKKDLMAAKNKDIVAKNKELATVESDIQTINAQIKKLQEQVKEKESLVIIHKHELKEITQKVDEYEKDLEQNKIDAIKSQEIDQKWLNENPIKPAIDLNKELEEIIVHNYNHEKVSKYLGYLETTNTYISQYQGKTADIETARDKKKKIIDETNLPIDGLTFDQNQLYLNDIPFADGEVSTSQIMDVAVKLLIALNPETKIFHISRGESLGADKFKQIVDFAKTQGYQGFIEEVVRSQDNLQVFEYVEK